MNGVIENLIALIVALSTATGGSVDVDKMPDRPAIVAPAPASAKTVNQQHAEDVEIKGVITAINGKTITVNGQTFALDSNTKVEGNLVVGANVQVEGVSQNGNLVATQVEVEDKSIKSSDDKNDDSKDKSIGSDDKGSDDKGKDVNDDKGKSGSDDKSKTDDSHDDSSDQDDDDDDKSDD